MIDSERILADLAFKIAMGQSIEDQDDLMGGRETILQNLGDDYVSYGLASGRKTADELLHRIELQAQKQAIRQGGKPR